MRGSKIIFYIISSLILFEISLISEEKITTSPLINLEKIKPSFEESGEKNEKITSIQKLKNKKKSERTSPSHAIIIGLDKITAKSKEIFVKLNEIKTFGPLEIKILKCGKIKNYDRVDDVAYMQVKDLSKNEIDKVFIFNGWTFASDPNLTPFDHAIYDLQLLSCKA